MTEQEFVDRYETVKRAMGIKAQGDLARRLRAIADILDGDAGLVAKQDAALFRRCAGRIDLYEMCIKAL